MNFIKKMLIRVGLIEPSLQDFYDNIIETNFDSSEIKLIKNTGYYNAINTGYYRMYNTNIDNKCVICDMGGPLSLPEIQIFLQHLSSNISDFRDAIDREYPDQSADKLADEKQKQIEEKQKEEIRATKLSLWKSI